MSKIQEPEYEQKLIYARMVIACLKDDKILATQEDADKFMVGSFSEEHGFGPLKKGKLFPYFRCKRAIKKDNFNPFLLGYAFKVFLEKKTDRFSRSITLKETSDGKDSEYIISLPDYTKYSTLRSYSLKSLYPFAWYGVKKKLDSDELTRYIDVDDEIKAFKMIKPFLNDVAHIQYKRSASRKSNHEKWAADKMKMSYYRSRFNSICKSAKLTDEERTEADLFFQALEQELTDINNTATNHYKKNRRFFRRIMLLSLFITVTNASNAALETSSLFDEQVLKWLLFALPLLAVIFSSVQLFIQSKYKDDQPKETWLRHRMNFSIIIEEIECFCEGIGDYKDILLNEPQKNRDAISKFQERITMIRKKDYERFFANMGVDIDDAMPSKKE